MKRWRRHGNELGRFYKGIKFQFGKPQYSLTTYLCVDEGEGSGLYPTGLFVHLHMLEPSPMVWSQMKEVSARDLDERARRLTLIRMFEKWIK
jgi:hypothetical protein